MERRKFIKHSSIALASAMVTPKAAGNHWLDGAGLIKKSLKIGMIEGNMTLEEKFRMVKELGFHGVELDSPNDLDPMDVLRARDKSGIEIPGVVNSQHWKLPLSDADPNVRMQCTESMKTALRDCKKYGGTTVLLVPAVVNEKTSYQEAYDRAIVEIKKMLPVAEETGIKIALENVWNNFLLSPLEAAQFVDEINHPLLGWYFDIGNILRYGWPEHWITSLGKRIIKIDIKEYSRKKMNEVGLWKGFEVELGDGDVNWSAVNSALRSIGYSGWGSAEVAGGNRERLAEISRRMDVIYKR